MPMPNRAKLFPRGYSGGQAESVRTHTQRGGDSEVVKLWDAYTDPQNHSELWTFRRWAIRVAHQMFHENGLNWFITQDTNPMVHEYNYQFLIDTLRFIGTGRRQISIHAWPDLVSNHPVKGLNDVSTRHAIADTLKDLGNTTDVDALIQMWCSREGGFDDMVCTLNILFGDLPLKVTADE